MTIATLAGTDQPRHHLVPRVADLSSTKLCPLHLTGVAGLALGPREPQPRPDRQRQSDADHWHNQPIGFQAHSAESPEPDLRQGDEIATEH
jgi:hypothetical protein